MSEDVIPDVTEISDFIHLDQNLLPEMEAYVRQKAVRLPRGYYDQWADKFGPYEPIRDESLAWSGMLPGLSIREWKEDFPGQPFPIVQRVDHGFPARYEEFLQQHRFDVELLRELGLDELEMERLSQELDDAQWWPIADCLLLEDDKFGAKDQQIGGHTLPAHGCLFGYFDRATWKKETHGVQRNIHRFDTDERDGTKEDDLYALAEVNFEFTEGEMKQARRRVQLWYHPDQVARRTMYERNKDPE